MFKEIAVACFILTLFGSKAESPLNGLKTNEIFEYRGYLAEVHHVTTEDGYILTVFRCNSKTTSVSGKKKPVILQHGLMCSTDEFSVNTPAHALSYVMADAGYDVWLPNTRGNYYSRNHTTLSPNESSFWNFTVYETGIYDHPAVIDYILKQTKSEQLHYVGHSQGATNLLILLTEKPEYNNKISAASLMGPITFLDHVDVRLKQTSLLAPKAEEFETTEMFPRGSVPESIAATKLCKDSQLFCQSVLGAFLAQSVNNTCYEDIIGHYPSGASYKQLLHYFQEMNLGYFGKYLDGSGSPTNFDFSKITAPILFQYSSGDAMAGPGDVEKMISLMTNAKIHTQKIDDTTFTHMDYVWGDSAVNRVYPILLETFAKY